MECGTALKTEVPEMPAQESQWDLCEIKVETNQGASSTEWRFVAEAVGPRGTHVVGATDWSGKDPESDLERLKERLAEDGWEPVETGFGTAGSKFRRPTGYAPGL